MNQDDAFLASIIENPDDDTPRLIYADWLDEHGQADRAEFIRVQCELARLPKEHPRWKGLWTRSRDLLTANRNHWLGTLRSFGDNAKFHRGFVDTVTIRPEYLLEQADELFRAAPLRRVICQTGKFQEGTADLLHPSSGPLMPKIAECPYLARLTALGLWLNHIGDDGLIALSRSPYLRRLTSLVLSWNDIGNAGLESLAASANYSLLTDLDLGSNLIGSKGVTGLATSPFVSRLKSLDLSDNGIGDDGVEAMAASPSFGKLVKLNLARNRVGSAGGRALANSPHLGRLKSLDLSGNTIGNKVRQALARRFGKGKVKF
jgi:uncharacterized protein (TIGR02996 family)